MKIVDKIRGMRWSDLCGMAFLLLGVELLWMAWQIVIPAPFTIETIAVLITFNTAIMCCGFFAVLVFCGRQ